MRELVSKFNKEAVALITSLQLNRDIRADSCAAEINKTCKNLGWLLTSVNYSKVGPFDHDLAIPIAPLPALDGMHGLTKLDPHSDDFHYQITRLRRDSNRLTYAFIEAEKSVERIMKEFQEWRDEN